MKKLLLASLLVATLAVPANARGFGRGFGGGFVAGAIIGGVVGSAVVEHECYWSRQPVFNQYGQQVGWRNVRVCD